MEDINKLREAALRDIIDSDEEWDDETRKNRKEKMNEPIGYTVVAENKENADRTEKKASA